jgi:hypothetical protein
MRRDSETITGRHARTARCPARTPPGRPHARVRVGQFGRSDDSQRGYRSQAVKNGHNAHGRYAVCKFEKMRHTACKLVRDVSSARSTKSLDKYLGNAWRRFTSRLRADVLAGRLAIGTIVAECADGVTLSGMLAQSSGGTVTASKASW